MKNYRSVSLNRIKDFETYAEKKLKAGHIIIEIRLNEERNEIRKIVSYAQDKNGQTWIWQKTDSEEMKRKADPCLRLENPDNEKMYCQYYVSVKQGDFKNWEDHRKAYSSENGYPHTVWKNRHHGIGISCRRLT